MALFSRITYFMELGYNAASEVANETNNKSENNVNKLRKKSIDPSETKSKKVAI